MADQARMTQALEIMTLLGRRLGLTDPIDLDEVYHRLAFALEKPNPDPVPEPEPEPVPQ